MSNVIVVGCGRVGSQLANMLSDNGSNVCVIDRNVDAFANLGRNFNGSTIQGVGFDEETLEKAGIDECDVVAAVTQLDNTNLMCCEVASRLFGVPHVIARLYNPDHERAYMQLGIDYVCGTSLVAEDVFSKVVSGHGAHLDTFGEFEVLLGAEYHPRGGDGTRSRHPHRGVRARRRQRQLHSHARVHPVQRGLGAGVRAP